MLSLSSLAPSLRIEMESEKMREEVKELIGTMWIRLGKIWQDMTR